MQKAWKIFLNSVPILIMIGLIPVTSNDYYLTAVYIGIIILSLLVKRTKHDALIFIIGFCLMIVFEAIFISTGVETFVRNSLFGVMPLWLPFLWGYGFIAIKRSLQILG